MFLLRRHGLGKSLLVGERGEGKIDLIFFIAMELKGKGGLFGDAPKITICWALGTAHEGRLQSFVREGPVTVRRVKGVELCLGGG